MELIMKRILLAATFLTAVTALSLPATAIDVNLGAGVEGAVDVIIGGGDAGADAGAAVGANVGVNAGANAGGGAGGGGGGNMAAGIDAAAAAVTEVTLRTNAAANATATVAANALINAAVWTNDNVNVGAVMALATATDGEVLLIIDTADGWVANLDQIAVRASAVIQTDAGLQIQTDDADLKASITAAMAANAAAGVR
jgi:hypothetical protein